MKLYHYSSTLYPVLLTRRRAAPMVRSEPGTTSGNGLLTEAQYQESLRNAEQYSDLGSYYDHVSFFFEPLPLEKMGKHFGNFHDFWFDGHLVYEHIVNLNDVPRDMRFDIVETPTLDPWWEQNGFKDNAPKAERLRVFAALRKAKEQIGEIGYNAKDLERMAKQFDHGVFDYYLKQKASKLWEEGKTKYAAGVPHVMIYSDIGRFPVSKVNQGVIGQSTRQDFSSVLKNFRSSQKW